MFLLIYFLSGAAALLYEVLWLRLVTLSVGHTATAVAILLAAFMGGLALGAWGVGRTVKGMSRSRALRVYAVLELGIAACALLLPLVLTSLEPLLAWAYADGAAGRRFDTAMAIVAFVLLALPAAAMGATFPAAIRWSARPGALYAANAAGAAFGAAFTGFVLVPLLGVFGTTMTGVALNVIAATGALALARTHADAAETVQVGIPDPGGRGRPPSGSPYERLAALAAMAAGVVSLLFQVTWTRTLAMLLGPTTYAFSLMLVSVIAGIAVGSTIVALRTPRTPSRAAGWCGVTLLSAAAAALGAAFLVDSVPVWIAETVVRPDVTFESVFLRQIFWIGVLQLPMTIALGAVFPLTLAMISAAGADAAGRASRLYALNTLGAIAGALLGSAVLIPVEGLQGSIRIGAGLLLAASFVVVRFGTSPRRPRKLAFAAATAAVAGAALLMPPWNPARLANGGYRYAAALADGDIASGLEAGQLLYYREGAAGTVSVREVPGARSLAIDGKVDASNAADMLTQKMLAHVPLLLHPDPRSVCIIGLGSGVTLGAALTHPIERADVVEISPQVVEASQYFERENHAALDDDRTRLIIGDGRAHLLLTRATYDVIISEPSNPWMAGVASLFTREFFEAARARLAPGGLLTQWAHTYSISDADLRSIVATFLSVFPDGTAWLVAESDLLLVGSNGPVRALDQGIAAAWERHGVAADLAEIDVRNPLSVLSLYIAGGATLRRFAGDAFIQTDDDLQLEYTAPRAVYGRFQQANVDGLRTAGAAGDRPPALAAALTNATAEDLRDRGLMQLRAHAPHLAFVDLGEAVRRAPADTAALNGFIRAASRAGRLDEAEKVLVAAGAFVHLSVVRAARGDLDGATRAALEAVIANPRNPDAVRQLASMYADRGDGQALEQLLFIADDRAFDRAIPLYVRARHAYVRGEYQQAIELGRQLAMLTPADVNVFNMLASAHAALGQHDLARAALETSRRLAPTDPGVLVNIGTVELRAGNPAAAEDRFEEALFLSPTLRPALQGLAEALEQQGNTRRAAIVRARAR